MKVDNKEISITDSKAKPFITQKGVILCRSGIQIYHKSELAGFISHDNKPKLDKEWYREYRPANVVVKAKELCRSLPVAKEHPDMWIDSKNFSSLAGGVTDNNVEVVALEGESEGEIGLKSDLTFFTDSLYDYYKDNKEVSLGYTCKKHFVDNPEEVGYDIVLDEITEVNHLAITRAGRGGSSVAVIDSLLGGMKPMRTGIFAWIASKRQKDSEPASFGAQVFEALKTSKGVTEEELAGEMKGVLDSCTILKDCEGKTTLINAVKDCFDHKDKALADEEAVKAQLDRMFTEVSVDSCKDFNEKSEEKAEDSERKEEEKNTFSEEKVDEKSKDSEEKPEEKEEKTEDSEEKPEEKEEKTEDSLPLDKEGLSKMIKDSMADALKPMVVEAVKECLGLKDSAKSEVSGVVVDSVNGGTDAVRDYSSFLDA